MLSATQLTSALDSHLLMYGMQLPAYRQPNERSPTTPLSQEFSPPWERGVKPRTWDQHEFAYGLRAARSSTWDHGG
ncbi:hypothetical protein V2G26_014461 [Clonostachys chloroleuca]